MSQPAWEAVIGLEVHCQLLTRTKIFSGANTAYGAAPNTQADAVTLGLPGVLPVLNGEALRMAVKFGLAVDAEIAERCVFARKHYFYPDLPKGYQISQYELPIVEHGHLDIEVDGQVKRIGITRAHMEEDAGKSLHENFTGVTGIDLNRAGTPLIEIVSEPDIRSAGEAVAYLKKLHQLVVYLGICDGNMQEGSFRCDANVSVRRVGAEKFGTRTETKNINSLRSVEQAVRFEMQRQAQVLEDGGTIDQETRHYQETDGTTSKGRPKETAEDYRYFNDPDLPPVIAPREWVEELRQTLPELPWVRRARIQEEWGIKDEEMRDLVNAGALDLIVDTVEAGAKPDEARSWWVSYLAGKANEKETDLAGLSITPQQVARVIALVNEGKLTTKLARKAVDGVLAGEGDVDEVVEKRGLEVVRDDGAIEKAVDDALAANPDIVEKYRAGNKKVTGAIVGAVMQATKGKADPKTVNQLIAKKLS
mgnify:CR=1 FL=1